MRMELHEKDAYKDSMQVAGRLSANANNVTNEKETLKVIN